MFEPMARGECNISSVKIEGCLTQEHKEVTSRMKLFINFFAAVGCVNLEGMAREY